MNKNRNLSQRLWALNIAFLLNSVFYVSGSDLSPGEATGHVEIAEGDSVNITCRMNPAVFRGKNASDLYFTGDPIPKHEIIILDKTTIVYPLKNAKAGKYYYLCNCNESAIMETTVDVGWAPKPVLNFSCQSYDFEYMVCQFERPHNYVLVTYKLSFYTRDPYYKFYPACSFDRATLVVCNITRDNNYNPSVDIYFFNLEANNSLATLTQNFSINNYNVMMPATPGESFHMDILTHNFTQFSWRLRKYGLYMSKGLQFEVLLQAHNGADQQYGNTVSRLGKEFRLRFDLPFAYYNYTLQLRAKMNTSNVWSLPFVYNFKSKPWRPERPPHTKLGSFYIDPSETTVRIYWEELEFTERNGYDFGYFISDVRKDGNIVDLKPLQSESTSAVFAWQKQSEYDFEIRSRNNMGESLKSSLIHVPRMKSQHKVNIHTPRAINNVYHATNRTYTLSWLPPERSDQDFVGSGSAESNDSLISYTIYWCQSKRALQNECRGTIRFVDVPTTATKYTTMPQSSQQEQNLNLAVSANYENFNTGMHWTTCTSDVNSDLIKMEPEARVLSSTVINLQWSSENVCPSILMGYNLTYCEVQWPANATVMPPSVDNAITTMEPIHCLSSYKYQSILDQNAKRFNIEGLKPYTIYRIEMKMYSHQKQGKFSDPLYVLTKEGAPSKPLALEISHITNTSAILSWRPPIAANGIIRRYEINLNNERISVLAHNLIDGHERIKYKLDNLMSNKDYVVFVTAFTVINSEPSAKKEFSTLIGYPQMPGSVTSSRNADNDSLIEWTRPAITNGRLEYYEVAVTQLRNDEIIRRRISLVNGTACAVRVPTCVDSEYRTEIDVRAVNVAEVLHEVSAEDLQQYKSQTDLDEGNFIGNEDLRCLGLDNWAEEELTQKYHDRNKYHIYRSDWYFGPNYNCLPVRLSRNVMLALLVVISGVGVMIGLYIARNVYNKMSDINCMLPPGLDYYLSKNGLAVTETDARHSERAAEITVHNNCVKGVVNLQHDTHSFHNEKHHLLSSISNDSCFLDESTNSSINGRQCGYEKSTPIPADYIRSVSQCSSGSSVGSSASTVEAEVPMNLPSFIKSNNLSHGKEAAGEQHELNHCLPSNYVTIENLNLSKAPASGYINPAQLQNNMPMTLIDSSNFVGYTTAEQLAKMNTIGIAENLDIAKETRISGYVTPGELNVFGKQQNRQVFDENSC